MKTREILLWIAAVMIGIPVAMFFLSLGSELVTTKNDVAVMAGFLIYASLVVGIGYVIVRFAKRLKKALSNSSNVNLMLLLVVCSGLMASACTKVEPGYVGIKVNQYGSQRGVEDFPILTGRVNYNIFTEDVYKFPTFLQNVVWTRDRHEGSPDDESITFNSVEGAVVNADIALSYAFVAEKVPTLFVEFRKDPDHITDVYMRSKVRDYFSRNASTMKVTEIFGEKSK